ncbi:MAG: site-specific DNA-methyltransferase, partial [Acidimicrobiales bacterium]
MAPRKPAPRKKATGPTPVEAVTHDDETRTTIPSAELADLAPDDGATTLRYPRDLALDPQLVWEGKEAMPQLAWIGKDDQDAEPLEVPAVPIYVQEKIVPQALVENLRKTAAAGEPEPEATLFDDFDGLDEGDITEFYEHDKGRWANRMILGDSLLVMTSLAEKEDLRGKVQMIYVDPPYGIKFGSNWQVSTRKRDVKDGKVSDATREPEQVRAFRDTWELGIHSYLSYLRDRLLVARDLLTETGSIFVQIGDENVHLVRSVMDEVFGAENFVSQITAQKTTGQTSQYLAGACDYLLWFAKSHASLKYRQLWRHAPDRVGYRWIVQADGTRRSLTATEVEAGVVPEGSRVYKPDNITSQRPPGDFPVTFEGRTFRPGKGYWKTGEDGMARLIAAGRLHTAKNSIQYVRYADDFGYSARSNVWTDTGTGNFTDDKVYVVQTGSKILERCILMTTDPGDLVLDPTCGSGTTAYVAEQWGRRWITTDTSRVALALARTRLMAAKFPVYLLADSAEGAKRESDLTGVPDMRGEFGGDIRQGFVYKRVPHITLKSIAQNPDIREGMSREEIDRAIAKHADVELLVDQPYVDTKKVRVSGRFTVESLSPHRLIEDDPTDPMTPDADLPSVEEAAEAASFEAM